MPDLDPIPALRRLVSELTRRRVVHAVAVYGVVAWVVIQVANIAFPALFIPRAALTVLVFVAVLGFPVVVALSWAFEISTEGVRRTPTLAEGERLSPALRVFFAACVVVATAGLGWVGWETWLSPRAESAAARGPAGGPAAGEGSADRPAELDPRKVAVLYFDDHSPGDTLAAFADGLTEHLIHRLAQVEALEVVSRRGVKPFRATDPPADSIARQLGAGSIVEGSVKAAGGELVVTAQLVDGRTQSHLTSEIVRRPAEEVFALQDEVAREVAGHLREHLGRQVQLESWRAGTGSPEAWRLVQQADRLREDARRLIREDQRGTALSLLAEGDSLLAEAESLAPAWDVPDVLRARLALARVDPGRVGRGPEGRRVAQEGLAHAEEVLRRDSTHPGARTVRGRLRFWLSQEADDPERSRKLLDRAERDLRVAVREDPGSARAHLALSRLLLEGRGEFREALYYAERAREADAYLRIPADTRYQLFYAAVNEGNFGDAARWCRAGQESYPERADFRNCELLLLATEGAAEPDVDRAWELVEELLARSEPGNRAYYRALSFPKVAAVLARAGDRDSARAVLRRARRDSPTAETAPFVAYQQAHARLLLGEEERALDLLSSFLERSPQSAGAVGRDPWFRPLRDRPRFRELVGR